MPSDADFMRWWRDFKSEMDPELRKQKLGIDKLNRTFEEFEKGESRRQLDLELDKDVRDWRTRPSQAEFEGRRQIELELDKDIRDHRTRPSAREFMEPPRGGPSSYMRSMGKFGEMLYELLGMAGPAKTGLFSKVMKRRKLRGKESDKIDPAEYDKWSDEVSKNAPDPTPENLLGQTKPDKHHLLGKRWFRGRGR